MPTAPRCPPRREPSRSSACIRAAACSGSVTCAMSWQPSTPSCPSRTGTPAARSGPAPARRLISRSASATGATTCPVPLPPGVLEPLALPYRSYRLAFTASLAADLYGDQVDATMLRAAGYVRDGEIWWLPSGRVFYSPDEADGPAAELGYARRNFFRPRRFRDPFGHTTAARYDRYDLLVTQTRDPLGNLVTAGERDVSGQLTTDGNDYRVLAPRLVSDPNRNRTAVSLRHARPGGRHRRDGQAGGTASATAWTASTRTRRLRWSPRTSPTRSPAPMSCSARRPPGCSMTWTPTGAPATTPSRSRPE